MFDRDGRVYQVTKDKDAPLERRRFLGLGASKVPEVATGLAGVVSRLSADIFRPPFALSEPEFLLACTQCDQCISACPHNVLFKLPESMERLIAGTPAMDLLNRGCHMCDDAPCVSACDPGALALPKPPTSIDPEEEPPLTEPIAVPAPEDWPGFGHAQINQATCLPWSGPECGACRGSCPVAGALEWSGGVKPYVNPDVCTGCGMCREACIMDPKAVDLAPLSRKAASDLS